MRRTSALLLTQAMHWVSFPQEILSRNSSVLGPAWGRKRAFKDYIGNSDPVMILGSEMQDREQLKP